MDEIWKDIEGWEGYQISSFGRARSIRFNKERILATFLSNAGYLFASVSKNGKRENLYIHKSVAKAFILNPYNKPFINHMNGIKTDNRSENFEWVSSRENQAHSLNRVRASKYYGVHKKNRNKGWTSSIWINKKLQYIGSFQTEEEAHEAYQKALSEHGIENKYAIA